LAGKINAFKEKKESFKEVITGYAQEKQTIAQRIQDARTNMSAMEQRIDGIKQEIHDQQMKEQELTFEEKGLKDRLHQAYKINIDETPQELSGQSGTEAQGPEIPLNGEELVQEIERLRKRCDAFGSVNLVAIEEYEELKKRFEFLTKQQGDLLEAKSQLMETITRINRSTRQMFMDTFTRVGEEFRIYYKMLFGGGEAELVLLDPENVLESGIDIIARPPGKKLQNISLLSGGEKTLTAIALIFGVFKVNPSPFCILDEIDAALDDSNVGRFSYLLKEFAKIAQFIVITHNKKTISSANVMYGITMPETGISRIVSVKFSDEKKEEPAMAAA
jgi:chromosome segregation protein